MKPSKFTLKMLWEFTCGWCGEFRMNYMYGWTSYKEEYGAFDDWPRCQECRGS